MAPIAAAAALAPGCRALDKSCTVMGCTSGATIVAHVPASQAAVEAATITFCLNGTCTTGTSAEDGGASSGAGPVLVTLPGPLPGTATIASEGNGWTSVSVQFEGFFTAADASDTNVQPFTAVSGDRYALTITGADGAKLLDFNRAAHYSDFYPNGKDCDQTPCEVASLNAWPASANGLTCSGHPIVADAKITLHPTPPPAGSTVRVCRNDVCNVTSALRFAVSGDSAEEGTLGGGPLIASYEISSAGTQLVLHVSSDPAVLADGDHYVASVSDPSGAALASADFHATYNTMTPNEPGCDPYPSRAVTYDAP
jgi:hypothetical protein